jgi:mono/diheme cytochrome c family protein
MRRRTLIAALAVLAFAPFALGACGGDDGGNGGGGDTAAEGDGGGGGAGMAGNAEAGAEVFASAGCGGCHTLAAADASGTKAPNLDELQPSEAAVAEQVRNGGGGMPAFGDRLSDQEIADVAAFVSANAGS